MKTTPWRAVLPVEEAGRFTPQQLDRAVCVVMERRRSYVASRPMLARSARPSSGASAARPAAARKPAPAPRPRGARKRKKPQAGG